MIIKPRDLLRLQILRIQIVTKILYLAVYYLLLHNFFDQTDINMM